MFWTPFVVVGEGGVPGGSYAGYGLREPAFWKAADRRVWWPFDRSEGAPRSDVTRPDDYSSFSNSLRACRVQPCSAIQAIR